MEYNVGDTITAEGIIYTFNGEAWTYKWDVVPGGVSTTITIDTPPVPDGSTPDTPVQQPSTSLIDDKVEYDFAVLSGLATGSLYANTVQAG